MLAFAAARGLEGTAALEMLMAEVHKGCRDPEMIRAFRKVVGGLRVDPLGGAQTAWCAT